MPKQRSRRDTNLRRQLAYQAARLIAVDGVADFAAAKWKAARQAWQLLSVAVQTGR